MAERNDSATFLKTVKDVLGWEDLNTDTVMDIGCGNGRTAMTFLRTFPKVGKVLAIDIAAECLRIAERMHPDGKIEYQLADIRNRSTLDRWVGDMDKAVSVFCFHCLDDVRSGYENMYRLLKPAGEAAILQSLRSGYYDFLNEIDNSPRWRDYFKEIRARMPMPVSYYENHSGDYYKKMLEEIGFEVVNCYEEVNTYGRTFLTDDACKNAVYDCYKNLVNRIPEGKRAEFKENCFQVFLKHNKRNDEGNLVMEHTTFSAFLRKP